MNGLIEEILNEDITELSLKQIKSRIEELNNKLNTLLEKKDQAYRMTQPKAKPLKEINVQGGTRQDRFSEYVIKAEKLDALIDLLQDEIRLLEDYLNKELERINKYDEWEQKVIYLRDDGKSWDYIACNTPFSKRTCQRIYKNYTGKREIEKD